MTAEKLRESPWICYALFGIMFLTYSSIFLFSNIDEYERFSLHGIKWFLYYASLLYLPFVCIVSGVVYFFISTTIEFPYKKVLYCTINMILTILISIVSFKNHLFVDSYIALVIFSIELWIVAFIDEYDKYDKLHEDKGTTFLISKQSIKPYNNLFDYHTGKELLHSDLSLIKSYCSTPELVCSVNNGMQSLLHRLSNGEYLLTSEDIKQIKRDLLMIHRGLDDDKFYYYKHEIYDLIKAIYLLDHTKPH